MTFVTRELEAIILSQRLCASKSPPLHDNADVVPRTNGQHYLSAISDAIVSKIRSFMNLDVANCYSAVDVLILLPLSHGARWCIDTPGAVDMPILSRCILALPSPFSLCLLHFPYPLDLSLSVLPLFFPYGFPLISLILSFSSFRSLSLSETPSLSSLLSHFSFISLFLPSSFSSSLTLSYTSQSLSP